MEQHSRTEDTPNSRRILEGQLRECYARVVYSHKTHEKCADILLDRLSRIKLAQIIFAAITTGGCITVFFGDGKTGALVGAVFSTALLGLNTYTKDFDLGELAQKHRQAASDLWLIRESYLSLLTDIMMREKPLESLQLQRDALMERLHKVYHGAPSTNFEAYTKAQDGLQRLEDMTFSEAEIDAFLPPDLKRNSQKPG